MASFTLSNHTAIICCYTMTQYSTKLIIVKEQMGTGGIWQSIIGKEIEIPAGGSPICPALLNDFHILYRGLREQFSPGVIISDTRP